MNGCRWSELLFRVLPVKAWRGRLLARHVDGCPACRQELATPEEAGRLAIRPESAGPGDSFWPAVQAAIERRRAKGRRSIPMTRRPWLYAAGISATAAAAVFVVLTLRNPKPGGSAFPAPAAQEFRLDSIELGSGPARAYLYQPRDSGLLMIWIGESR